MPNSFEWTDAEKASTTGAEQLAMFERLVDFVNARLAEIQSLQTKVEDVKADVDQIKNDTPKTSK
jgi:prefoldin subunit 5